MNASKKPTETTGKKVIDKTKKKKGAEKIKDQCFDKDLKGIGKVTFESYRPDTSKDKYADATFKIKKDKKEYETLPGMEKDNTRKDKKFKDVKAVEFADFNDDEKDDILIINTYSKKDSKEDEARIYQQGDDKKFAIDKELTDAINKNVKDKTIDNIKKYIDSTKKHSDEWKQAYIDWVRQQNSQAEFDLFDLNGDDIPEIAAMGPSNADGTVVATYADGQVQEMSVWAMGLIYEEGKNRLDDSSGNMDEYYDHVYEIKDGKWNQVADGEYGAEDNSNIQLDENGEKIYRYKWNDADVDKATYESNLSKIFNKNDAKVIYEYGKEMTADEVIARLQSENVELSTHSNYKAPEESSKSTSSSVGSADTDSESTDYAEISMDDILGVEASSELSENGMTHTADSVLDGDDSTAWVEGADGQGIGDGLDFSFDDTYKVSGMYIKAGFQLDDETYYKNSRPKEITLVYYDGTEETVELEDYNGEQRIVFDHPVNTRGVVMRIESVYEGDAYEDTCITEISFF